MNSARPARWSSFLLRNRPFGSALPKLDHLAVLTDDVGVIQHALETVPNRKTGYCTDDVARAFIVALARLRTAPRDERALRLASTYLAFLQHAQLDDGRFHNFMAYDRTWLDAVGTQDSCGRAIWALGYGIAHAGSPAWRRVCAALFDRALGSLGTLRHVRSRAYAMLGLAHACLLSRESAYVVALRFLSDALLAAYERTRSDEWPWFETCMTYDNARLPEALIRAGEILGEPRHTEAGLAALAFYERVTLIDDVFVPIGNEGWYPRGGRRAFYAQQPLEAHAFVDAELAALDATGNGVHLENAELGFAWYYGKNSRGVTMANGGGCYDGLAEDSVNRNMGAESTLALLAAAAAISERRTRILRVVR